RDLYVTGVQTCALPISYQSAGPAVEGERFNSVLSPTLVNRKTEEGMSTTSKRSLDSQLLGRRTFLGAALGTCVGTPLARLSLVRSEERRVGKESRSRWS